MEFLSEAKMPPVQLESVLDLSLEVGPGEEEAASNPATKTPAQAVAAGRIEMGDEKFEEVRQKWRAAPPPDPALALLSTSRTSLAPMIPS